MSAANQIKTMKIAELYPRKYGMAAYQAWLHREDSFRLMKAVAPTNFPAAVEL